METQTEYKIAYENLTAKEKKEICNGCGGKGGFVKPPHKAFYKASCNHHDYAYFVGCTKEDKNKADKMFYELMIKDCSSLPWYSYIRYRPWCWLYYNAVKMIGSKFFYYGDAKRYPKREVY